MRIMKTIAKKYNIELYFNNYYIGAYYCPNHIVFGKDVVVMGKPYLKSIEVFLHEVGHYLDYQKRKHMFERYYLLREDASNTSSKKTKELMEIELLLEAKATRFAVKAMKSLGVYTEDRHEFLKKSYRTYTELYRSKVNIQDYVDCVSKYYPLIE